MTEPLQDLAALLRAGVITRCTITYHGGVYTVSAYTRAQGDTFVFKGRSHESIEEAGRACVQKAEPQ